MGRKTGGWTISHTVRCEHRGAYVCAAVTGDNTPDDVMEYLDEVRESCLGYGCPRVLIEEDLKGPSLGTMAIYDIVTRGSRRAAPAVSKIAFLDLNAENAQENMKFAETLAVNRWLDVRFFTDRREAEQWLVA